MQVLINKFSANTFRRLRFILAGFCVAMAVLVPGVIWYKSVVKAIAAFTADQTSSSVKMRYENFRRQMESAASSYDSLTWRNNGGVGRNRLRRDLPFDLVVVFDHERKMVDGFRMLSETNKTVNLTGEAAEALVPVDSSFFDRLSGETLVSGLLMMEDKPLVIASRRIATTASGRLPGYLVIGKWLSFQSSTQGQENFSSTIDAFSIVGREELIPLDIKEAMTLAQRSSGMTFDVTEKGEGTIYLLLDDIMRRPALVLRTKWSPWQSREPLGLGVFYLASLFAGVGTWLLLVYFDNRNRHRTRRYDGISSMSQEQLRIFVESFPGLAFVLNAHGQYLAMSRILAGITGHEPSDFVGHDFGKVASEYNQGLMLTTFEELRDPACWPPVAQVKHVAHGLGRDFEFAGMAHYVSKHDILMVILGKDDRLDVNGQPVQIHHTVQDHSAVA